MKQNRVDQLKDEAKKLEAEIKEAKDKKTLTNPDFMGWVHQNIAIVSGADIAEIAKKLFADNAKDGKDYILKEELKGTKHHDVFDVVDADKDGKITVKEI